MRKVLWSAAVRRMNLARLGDGLRALEAAGCHELHIDIMDGAFVPGFGLGLDIVAAIQRESNLPMDVHLMSERPERHLERLAEAGCASLSLHVEACLHAHRALAQIRELGMEAGIAIGPATALTRLEYLLPEVDRVLILAEDPGTGPRRVVDAAFERVKILRENLSYREHGAKLQVEGCAGPADAARFIEVGVDLVVLDTASLFGSDDLASKVRHFVEEVEAERKVV